jgi:hypothetical protein
MAHFTAVKTAAVLVINSEQDTRARLVAIKGDWAMVLEQPPSLDDSLMLRHCPLISIEQLHSLPSRVYQQAASGTIPISDGRVLNLDALLGLDDGRALLTEVSEADLENVA